MKPRISQQEVDKQSYCAYTALTAIRTMCNAVNQLHDHILTSQQQQQQQNCSQHIVYAPVTSDIHRLSDVLEGKIAASQQIVRQATRQSKARSKLNGLVKAFKPSLGQGAPKTSSASPEPSGNESGSQIYPDESPVNPMNVEDQLRRQSALRQGLAELQSRREGQQCLLKALLQLEGMRVLDNCLAAFLT